MYIYIITFLITILLVWLAENKAKSRKNKIILLILAVVPMFFISAIRYNVGTDYEKRYVADYYTLLEGKNVGNLEIGFKAIDYLCLFFTKEPYLLFVITSLIILAIIFEVIYKKSSNRILSIIVFFLGGYFFATLNIIRQYISVAFILLGYQFLMSENKKKAYIGFVICAILAFFMHSSSIICFIIILLTKKNIMDARWVIPLSILILILNKNIMVILTPIIKNTRFNVYLTGKFTTGELSILQIVENLIIYLAMYFSYYFEKKQGKELDKQGITLLNIQGLALLLTVSGVIHTLFIRMAIYFVAFQIISIPYFFSILQFNTITDKINKKLKKNLKTKTVEIIIYSGIVLGFSAMFIYTNILNNDNEVLPYKTIFSIQK
ncbi:MAG: hypothetical protein BHV99_06800 [Clostridium sp. 26_21]|nr:MAG: hypothetical protein BHV99_06800 [Clostridium sp. 26_21]